MRSIRYKDSRIIGCFLEVSKFSQVRKRQNIIVPAGYNGWGWSRILKFLNYFLVDLVKQKEKLELKRGKSTASGEPLGLEMINMQNRVVHG